MNNSNILLLLLLIVSLIAGYGIGNYQQDIKNLQYLDSEETVSNTNNDSIYTEKFGTSSYQLSESEKEFPGQLKPNVSTMADSAGIPPFKVRTNSDGFRDEEFDKEPGVKRVAVIGGSITMGSGVNESDRYTEIVERRLNENTENEYRVYNLGSPGLGMQDFAEIFRKKIPVIDPDYVVVTLSGGDFFTHSRQRAIHREALRELDLPENISEEELEQRKRSAKISAQREVEREIVRNTTRLNQTLGAGMSSIAEIAEERDFELMFYKVAPIRPETQDFVQTWSETYNVPVRDAPDEILDNIRNPEYTVSKIDHHPNPKGHRILGKKLADYIVTEPATVLNCFTKGGPCEQIEITSRPKECIEWWGDPEDHQCEHTTSGIEKVHHISNPANYITGKPTDSDYETERLVKRDLDGWDLEFLPNGTPILTHDPGKVFLIQNGSYNEIAEIETIDYQKGGLMGLAVHPNFEENRLIYLYYTTAPDKAVMEKTGTTVNSLVRYRLEEGDLKKDKKLLEQEGGVILNGGRIEFGPDNKLYLTAGNAYNKTASQSLDDRRGKILRLNPDGTVPEDNPFEGKYIYSYGHRNPQGLAWHPATNDLFSSEHGDWRHGEFNQVQPGHNYGWGIKECEAGKYWSNTVEEKNNTEFHPPLRCYTNWTLAPSGMTFVDDAGHPWHGKLFSAGLRSRHIRLLDIEESSLFRLTEPKYRIDREEVFWVNKDGMGSKRLREVEYHNGSLWVMPNQGSIVKLTPSSD